MSSHSSMGRYMACIVRTKDIRTQLCLGACNFALYFGDLGIRSTSPRYSATTSSCEPAYRDILGLCSGRWGVTRICASGLRLSKARIVRGNRDISNSTRNLLSYNTAGFGSPSRHPTQPFRAQPPSSTSSRFPSRGLIPALRNGSVASRPPDPPCSPTENEIN